MKEIERESLSENTCEMGSFVIIKRNLGTWKEKKSNGGIFVGVRKSDKDDCKCNRPLLFYFCFLHIWSRIIVDFKISWFGNRCCVLLAIIENYFLFSLFLFGFA